ncbi:MAG: DUF1501 domain-containing protein [Gammaproteobacteria bacterium]|nr:DUF1501 domain-containing protein [Gammaproteobacteria bacterium]
MAAFNRRQFLKATGAGAAAAFASYPGGAFAQGVGMTAPFNDYKALVCVFLFGGNDSYNMLVPRSNAEYGVYAASRQNLAISQTDLLPITPQTPDGAAYGLHPSMGGLQGLFNSNRVALVSNMGPLVEPTTRDQYLSGAATLPPQLFSHNDQMDQWHTLKGANVSKTGWAGRVADLIQLNVAGQQMATNASLFGSSLFQSANDTIAYVMGPGGPIPFDGFGDTTPFLEQRQAFANIIGADYDSIYERGYAEIQRRAVASADLVSNAIANAPVRNTVFPQSVLGRQLQTIAQLIDVRDDLQMQRQIFFVGTGGFDSHDDQNINQPGLLGGVSEALTAFYNATVEIGMADSVTSFTQSDFARTLTSNGDGTDHAWGGIQLAVGDAVNGDMYGTYPSLQIGGSNDVGGGRLIPTTSADQYAATLAKWFGIDDADMSSVAPNLDNFVQRDLGFML